VIARPAEGHLGLRVPVDDAALGVDGDVCLAGAVDDQARLLLALPKGQLGLLLLRDVDHEAPVEGRLVALVADHHSLVADPDLATVSGPHAVLAHRPGADVELTFKFLVLEDPLPIVGVDVAHPQARVCLPFLGAVAEQLLDAGADVVPGRIGTEIGNVEDRRQVFDHGPVARIGILEIADQATARPDARPGEDADDADPAGYCQG
jgi:hypothetical protein